MTSLKKKKKSQWSLGLTGLISLHFKGTSRVFSSTTIWKALILQHSAFWVVLTAVGDRRWRLLWGEKGKVDDLFGRTWCALPKQMPTGGYQSRWGFPGTAVKSWVAGWWVGWVWGILYNCLIPTVRSLKEWGNEIHPICLKIKNQIILSR